MSMTGIGRMSTTTKRTHKCKKCGWEKGGKKAPLSCMKCKGTEFSFKKEKVRTDMTIEPPKMRYADA